MVYKGKKLKTAILLLLCVFLLFAVSACGRAGQGSAQAEEEPTVEDSEQANDPDGSGDTDAESAKNSQDPPFVYFTSDISPAGLETVYEALGRKAEGENGCGQTPHR